MTAPRPSPLSGLRHLALNVNNLAACEAFYVGLLGLRVDWRPDADNLYLTSGGDNLALHRAQVSPGANNMLKKSIPGLFQRAKQKAWFLLCAGRAQRLNHFGFVLDAPQQADAWHDYLRDQGVMIKAAPRDHRDGSRSFYCLDPDGNTVQFIFLPTKTQNDA